MKDHEKKSGELAYIGVGSNIGDREGAIETAKKSLCGYGISLERVSPIYESEGWGVREQPCFLNAVFEVRTPLSPHAFLIALKDIERKMGRRKNVRWGPREIDLDILYYGRKIVISQALVVPHIDLHLRAFVLFPLNDLAPDFLHPVLKKTNSQLLRALSDEDRLSCWLYQGVREDEKSGL